MRTKTEPPFLVLLDQCLRGVEEVDTRLVLPDHGLSLQDVTSGISCTGPGLGESGATGENVPPTGASHGSHGSVCSFDKST